MVEALHNKVSFCINRHKIKFQREFPSALTKYYDMINLRALHKRSSYYISFMPTNCITCQGSVLNTFKKPSTQRFDMSSGIAKALHQDNTDEDTFFTEYRFQHLPIHQTSRLPIEYE